MRKAAFDRAPAGGEIRVAIGQGPDCVQVIRQDNCSFDGEGVTRSDGAKGGAQQADMFGQQGEGRSARLTVKRKLPPGTKLRR
jgi:hypothetical protein